MYVNVSTIKAMSDKLRKTLLKKSSQLECNNYW